MPWLGRKGPTRTIADPLERGPNKKSYSAQVTTDQLGDHPILYWAGELQPITILGSSPELPVTGGTANNIEWTAVLRYQAGGVAREESWSWQPQGWQRTVLAAQAEIVARRVDGGAAPRVAMTYGATLVEGAWARDRLNFVVRHPTVSGSQPITQVVPQGTTEFRAWQSTQAGTVEVGFVLGLPGFGTFNGVYSYSFADLADWIPWPNGCNAVQYDNAAVSSICTVETRV